MLSMILVDDNRYAVGKIERTRLCSHRYTHAIAIILVKEFFVKSFGFPAEKYPAVLVILDVRVVVIGLCGRKEKLRFTFLFGILYRQSDIVASIGIIAEVCR